jgi:hypothetical protein
MPQAVWANEPAVQAQAAQAKPITTGLPAAQPNDKGKSYLLGMSKPAGTSQRALRSQARAGVAKTVSQQGWARWAGRVAEAKEACQNPAADLQKDPSDANKAAYGRCKQAQRAEQTTILRRESGPIQDTATATGLAGQVMAAEPGGGQMSMLSESCPIDDEVVFANPLTLHVDRIGLFASSGKEIVATTSNLHLPTGVEGFTPDSVMAVLYCDTDPTCQDGQIIQIDDDGNDGTTDEGEDRDSKVEFTTAAAGFYWIVIFAYEPFSMGIADVSVTVDATELLTGGDQYNHFFGGYSAFWETRPGDSLYVGISPEESWQAHQQDPEFHDSVLFHFSSDLDDCDSGCGTFHHNDDVVIGDATSRLSRIPIAAEGDTWNGRILVGSAEAWHALPGQALAYELENVSGLSARLFHVRTHTEDGGEWTCDEQLDADGDGLPHELENWLGSCDSLHGEPYGIGVGVNGFACRDFGELIADGLQEYDDRRVEYNFTDESDLDTCSLPDETDDVAGWSDTNPNCWRAVDSDNDVLQDPWEVWAVFFACDQPPAAPLYTAGNCAPLPLSATSCPSGKWCTVEDLSSDSGVSPDVYDVIVDSIAFKSTSEFAMPTWCDSMSCSTQTHDHAFGDTNTPSGNTETLVPADQAAFFERVFTEEPQECWDGSTDQPCLDADRDIPYRARLHVYNRDVVEIADDSLFGHQFKTLRHDQIWSSAQVFNWGFRTARRWAKISRLYVATHWGGGASNEDGTIMGNTRKTVYDAALMVHEIGHHLGLGHMQRNVDIDNGTDCAVTPCSAATDNDEAWAIPHLSIMTASYGFLGPTGGQGFASKTNNDSPPTSAINVGSECQPSNFRFSKGLNPTLNESSLQEQMTLGADHWRAKKMANELRCFQAGDEDCGPNEYGTDGTGTDMIGPVCTSTTCSFDWNRNENIESGSMSFNLSYGDFDQDNTCDEDILYDLDEWRRLMAYGRATYDALSDSHPNYLIYSTSFNGGHAENDAGWSFDIDAEGAFTDARYPVNLCDYPVDPGDPGCRKDTCATSSDCRNGNTCTAWHCQCTSNSDCFSDICESSGVCFAEFGARQCDDASDCDGQSPVCRSESGYDFCSAYQDGTAAQTIPLDPPNNYWPSRPRLAMQFGGPPGDDYLKLDNTGSYSPLHSMVTNGALQVYFDFKLEGFDSGKDEQVLFKNDAFDIRLFKVGMLAQIEINGGSAKPIEELIWPHNWYRVRWAWSDTENIHFLQLVALDASSGEYMTAEGVCIERPWTAAVTTSGDFWFGYDGSDDDTRFRGEMDNISILNYMNAESTPVTCTEEP